MCLHGSVKPQKGLIKQKSNILQHPKQKIEELPETSEQTHIRQCRHINCLTYEYILQICCIAQERIFRDTLRTLFAKTRSQVPCVRTPRRFFHANYLIFQKNSVKAVIHWNQISKSHDLSKSLEHRSILEYQKQFILFCVITFGGFISGAWGVSTLTLGN